MTGEVRAALERWRQPPGTYRSIAGGIIEAAINKARLDACVLADAMVVEHPEDEDTSIDAAWLESQGFGPAWGDRWRVNVNGVDVVSDGVGCLYVCTRTDVLNYAPIEGGTRGHVRRLLAALGVPTVGGGT